MGTSKTFKVDFSFQNTLPAQKTVSGLTAAKQDLVKTTEAATRSFSSYFKEFRRNNSKVRTFLEEANKKGRVFDADLVTAIIANGDKNPLLAADDAIQAAKEKPAQYWTAQRVYTAFIKATEIVKVKEGK